MPSTLFSFLFLLLLPFPTLSHLFSPPDNYLINCGSAAPSTLVDHRPFAGDLVDHRPPFPRAVSLRNYNPLPDLLPIYHTARVFTSPARYSFPVTDKGTHIVRLHFHPFNSSNIDLGRAQFHVLVNGHVVLRNFTCLANGSRNPRIVEYLIWVNADSLVVVFVPNKDLKLTFVNAIEVIFAPKDLVPETAQYLSPSKVEKFEGLKKQSLEVLYRVTVGGVKVTPFNDSFWIPNDGFFCDIAGISLGLFYFNVYVNGHMAYEDLDLSYITNSLASPFYTDFVVDGEGALSVGVGPLQRSMLYVVDGILNAIEVMTLNNYFSSLNGILFALC